jgi:hypothetical protein
MFGDKFRFANYYCIGLFAPRLVTLSFLIGHSEYGQWSEYGRWF